MMHVQAGGNLNHAWHVLPQTNDNIHNDLAARNDRLTWPVMGQPQAIQGRIHVGDNHSEKKGQSCHWECTHEDGFLLLQQGPQFKSWSSDASISW